MPTSTRIFLLITFVIGFSLTACTGDQLAASNWPGVTATEDFVYLAFGQNIYALHAADGRLAWSFPEETENNLTFFAAPALAEGGSRLIAGAYNNALYSLDPETGEIAGWTFTEASNRYIADIHISDSGIFAANSDGKLYGLDFSGAPLWSEHYNAGEPIWAGPAEYDGNLYFASLDHQVHAVNMATGELVWATDLGSASAGVPAILDGILYTGTFGSRIFALDAATGAVIWEFETGDWVFGSVAAADGVVYAGDIGGLLYAIDASDGSDLWRFKAEGGIYGGPIVIDGSVHFGTDSGQFYALTDSGEIDWFYAAPGKIYSPPRYNGEYIFIATMQSDVLLTALDTDGTARWPFTPEN
ncbi:MAG TPA: PQQ-binding-like beta-propeller repeat protein [Anaerolineales bacterium]|nr:PQQ-binding-like beta-propeller repeat protein [Anaerolineales bacterium]